MTIVLTGGSGFIGTALSKRLLAEGHTVIVVAKRAPRFTHQQLFFIQCDLAVQPFPYNILERADAVIHLAGVSFYQPWKKDMKDALYQSRVITTKHVVESMRTTTSRPAVFICGSSTYYYPDTTEPVTETSGRGEGFLADTIAAREHEALHAAESGVRLVILRTAPILGHGGFIAFLRRLSRFRLWWKLSKQEYTMSWVHEDDVVNAYHFAIETKTLEGVVNVAAPTPLPGSAFMRHFAKTFGRALIGILPKKLQKIFFGDFYAELIKNHNIISERLLAAGFQFQYDTAESALQSLKQK